jgi:hypothetical protein
MRRSYTFRDAVRNSVTDPIRYPLEFNVHDGYYPLLRLPTLYHGVENPYFHNLGKYARSRVMDHIRLDGTGYSYKYRMKSKGVATLYSGFYSAIGIASNLEYLPSSILKDVRNFRMYGIPDIFCIGVVSTSNLPEIRFIPNMSRYSRKYSTGQAEVTYYPDTITILVSTEKLRKTKFMKDNYTLTVRREIFYRLEQLQKRLPFKIKDVSNDYLTNFYSVPDGVRTNSIVEAIKIENEIKSNVFSNINSIVA